MQSLLLTKIGNYLSNKNECIFLHSLHTYVTRYQYCSLSRQIIHTTTLTLLHRIPFAVQKLREYFLVNKM
jgi:hypothetical protein